MAIQRRRRLFRCPIPAATAFTAAALSLLLVLAVLSYLAPPLLDHTVLPGVRHDRRPPRTQNRKIVANHTHGRKNFKFELWGSPLAKNFCGCSNASDTFSAAEAITRRDRYLLIVTSGGLNQQRTGITDAVVAARILNATLVVPKLDQRSYWKDSSNFDEIFDVGRFISYLSKDVKILKELPKKGGKYFKSPYTMRVPRKCTPRGYLNRVLPVLLKKHVVQLTKFDYRLANKLDNDLQKLRCRVNYHALGFTHPIQEMGNKLVLRMKAKGKQFIALHLRYEPDMLAFSGCYYGGGDKERKELGAMRKRWKTLHIVSPEKARRQGRCPLTPEEVGQMLRALGYGSDVHIYVASGEIYGGETTLAPLKTLFPNYHTKETLARKEELLPFSSFSSRMAALDFIVCDESDAFVTNNNGNMAKILAGRRRYFGHKRTIRPNAKKLHSLFLNRANFTWEEFASKVRFHQRGFLGDPKEIRPGRGEFHENPATCICEVAETNTGIHSGSQSEKNAIQQEQSNKHEVHVRLEDHLDPDEDMESSDLDYGESTPLANNSSNARDMEFGPFATLEESDYEEILSD